jgi:zinc D-Ala-D-Ala carboxypeptidase|tara:strand:+ start:704 stop:1141 length:438 start_codon:yes stop_codon:yes gene_type:complete
MTVVGPYDTSTAEAHWDEARWPNFSIAELACQCGCGQVLWNEDTMDDTQAVRDKLEHGVTLSSGYRCPNHNDAISSTGRKGPHTRGAQDLALYGGDAIDATKVLLLRGVTGFGAKQHGPHAKRFVHHDRLENAEGCPRPWQWSYK